MTLNVYSSPNNTHRPKTTENNQDDRFWVVIVIGIVVVFVCASFCMLYFYRKKRSEFVLKYRENNKSYPFQCYKLICPRHQYQPEGQTRYGKSISHFKIFVIKVKI